MIGDFGMNGYAFILLFEFLYQQLPMIRKLLSCFNRFLNTRQGWRIRIERLQRLRLVDIINHDTGESASLPVRNAGRGKIHTQL